jgi:hypothetical protein
LLPDEGVLVAPPFDSGDDSPAIAALRMRTIKSSLLKARVRLRSLETATPRTAAGVRLL